MNRLPELLSNSVSTFPAPIAILIIVMGMVCMMAGSRFYWLAAGLNAFLAMYIAASTAMNWLAWQGLLASGIAGLLVALFTIVLQRISFSLNGFFIFGLLISIIFAQLFSFENNSFTPVIFFFVAGSAAAFFNLMKPPAALIYTTAFIGGFAIACGLFRLLHQVPNALYMVILWTVLGLAGSLFQIRNIERSKQEISL